MLRLAPVSLVLLLQLFTTVTKGQVPLTDFYAYGTSAGDRQLPRVDDASTRIPIQFAFPFFDSTFREVHISTNGIINFGNGSASFVPQRFPLVGFKSIASYWTDSDPSEGGNVHYRESNLPSLLNKTTQDIRARFVQHSSFTSRWALVVTFDKVSSYGCRSSPASCSSPCTHTLTYQTVLTSNGVQSFAIFNFNTLDYTRGTYSCGANAQVGFNAGDGKRFYLLPLSNTPNIARIALTTSNVGVPGKWMFTIDGSDISEGCNSRGLLEIYPKKLLYFGSQDIIIGGPCFQSKESKVNVLFGNSSVVCNITSVLQLKCLAPLFTKLGRNNVSLTYNNIKYQSFVVVVDTDDKIVGDSSFGTSETSNQNADVILLWNSSVACGANDTIIFKGFQFDYILELGGRILAEEIATLNYAPVANSGRTLIRPKNILRPLTMVFIRRISVAGYCSRSPYISIARTVFMASQTLCSTHCLFWHTQQPSASKMRDIVDQVSRRNPCPPGVASNFPETTGNFGLDESCSPSNPSMCAFFHPNAKACYRSLTNVDQRVTQCCYDSKLRLILGPPGGGTLDFADSSVSTTDHFWKDVLPYMTCCKFGLWDHCEKYFEKRPSIDSRFFAPPSNGNGKGDPHFTTLDGTKYTFNPVGEFIYLKYESDAIQTRISQYKDGNEDPKQASYFSAFVVKSGQSDIVQVELSSVQLFTFRINGQPMTLEYGPWAFDGISLNYIDNATVSIQTASAIGIEISIIGGVFNAIVSLPVGSKGKVSGLVGNWDDDDKNDFQLPNGTSIPANSSATDIHFKFGMAWSTTNHTSLFSYPTGLSWSDYQNKTFSPSFAVPVDHPACNGDRECSYDVAATGELSVALSNVVISKRVAEMEQFNKEIVTYCPTSVSVANGYVTVEGGEGSPVSYSVTCKDGYVLYGRKKVTCANGKYDTIGVCESTWSSSKAPLTASGIMTSSVAAVFILSLGSSSLSS